MGPIVRHAFRAAPGGWPESDGPRPGAGCRGPGAGGEDGGMIGQLHSVVIDAPDAYALAGFYAELLGMEVKGSPGDEWVVLTGAGHRLAFQQAPNLEPPDWPDPDRPQQFHLDVYVRDIDDAEPEVLALGARRLPGEGGDFRVYADPAGHPFCLVWDA
jgi:catechol 2,3-dioxygenase-like lactoylglutathione lyase family enzyme